MAHIMGRIPAAEHETFNRLGYTIGGMMVFPGNKVGGARTINGERGCNSLIDDRFDLTVECIRRHYLGEPSPLSDALARYPDFFALSAISRATSTSSTYKTSSTRRLRRSGSSHHSTTSPGRRDRQPSTPTSRTATTLLSSWNRATGESPRCSPFPVTDRSPRRRAGEERACCAPRPQASRPRRAPGRSDVRVPQHAGDGARVGPRRDDQVGGERAAEVVGATRS
jgi:hypothetical protein